jgi:RNase P subunit RPR2
MIVTRYGDIIKGFKFVCKHCNAEWYANKQEVKITPPFMEYAVYMNCPCCGQTTYTNEGELK